MKDIFGEKRNIHLGEKIHSKLYFVFDSVNKFFFEGIFHRKIWFKNLIEVKKSVTSNPPSPVDTDSRCSLIRPFINDLVVPRQKAQATFFKVSHSVDVDFWNHTQQNLLNLKLVLMYKPYYSKSTSISSVMLVVVLIVYVFLLP